MIKTIKFESLNLSQFIVTGIVTIDKNDNAEFHYEFFNKGFKGTEKLFCLTIAEVKEIEKYARHCLADIER